MEQKILILGSSGMAGHLITLYFQEQGYDVASYTTKTFNHSIKNIIGNAFDTDKLKDTLLNGNYDTVINCIGILNHFAENNCAKAVYLNSYLPHLIADTLKDTPTRLIHMSTDCVFAGNTGPYTEDFIPDGHKFYDRTKALGEVIDNKNLTFRNSIIGPDLNCNGIGLFNWFMKQKGTIKGYTRAIWTGVTTLTLAKAMEQALNENLTGLFNLVNNTCISKYDLLQLFNKHFRYNEIEIIPDDSLKLDKTLICTRKENFSFEIPSYEDMVIEMKEWIVNHKSLYMSYYN